MKNNILIFLLCLCASSIFSQSTEKVITIAKNNIIVAYYPSYRHPISIHYERNLSNAQHHARLMGSIGLTQTLSNTYHSYLGIPVWMTLLRGKRKNHIEAGLGYWWQRNQSIEQTDTFHTLSVKMGYRFQNMEKSSLFFKAGIILGKEIWFDDDYWTTDTVGSLYLGMGHSF